MIGWLLFRWHLVTLSLDIWSHCSTPTTEHFVTLISFFVFQLITSKTLSANFGSNLFPASNYIITISQMALLRFRFTPKYTLSYTHTKSVCLSASCTQWFSHISFILRKNCLWDQLADIEVVVLDGGAWIAELYHTLMFIGPLIQVSAKANLL